MWDQLSGHRRETTTLLETWFLTKRLRWRFIDSWRTIENQSCKISGSARNVFFSKLHKCYRKYILLLKQFNHQKVDEHFHCRLHSLISALTNYSKIVQLKQRHHQYLSAYIPNYCFIFVSFLPVQLPLTKCPFGMTVWFRPFIFSDSFWLCSTTHFPLIAYSHKPTLTQHWPIRAEIFNKVNAKLVT